MNFLELNRQVITGKSNGKIIWQPRIECWLEDRKYSNIALPEPYTGMSKPELYKALGCSNRVYDYNGCFEKVFTGNITMHEKVLGNPEEKRIEKIVETPVGSLRQIMKGNSSNYGSYHEKWPVENPEDLKVATWIEEHTDWVWNQEHYDKTYEEWGDLGLPSIFVPRITVQSLYLNIMGVQGGVYALIDYPSEVEKYFAALNESTMRMINGICKSPLEWINFGDNIHGSTLSPYFFEKYVLPVYQERCDVLRSAGKFTFAHWDGDTKPLLKYAKECGLDGIEAITPLPQGDVTVEEMKDALGDEVYLVDGIAAILFEETFPEEQLIEQVEKLIEAFAPKLVLGISDEMPSNGKIERIKLVGDIVDKYNNSL